MVVFGQKCLYSGKSSCFLAKVVLIGQGVRFGQKWLSSGKSA